MPSADVLVVGAGFAGAVVSERLAAAGHSVRVIDRRDHIGGNAYDELDAHGVLVHRYGPHIFHTNSATVFQYLSRFTRWRSYEHRVLARIDGMLVPLPVNLTTLELLFSRPLDADSGAKLLESEAVHLPEVRTSEDIVLSKMGRTIYEKIYLNYTIKQWGRHPATLDATVAGRLPVRLNRDDRYFTDEFQAMPADGYTTLFHRMLSHPRISLSLSTDFGELDATRFRHVVFTGPVDAYFGHRYGPLPYRSLQFEFEHHAGAGCIQPVGTVNSPNDGAYTRTTEFKHLTGQVVRGTTVCREFPTDCGDPYYPVPTAESRALYARYAKEAEREEAVTFVGRLATFQYYNMDQVVAQALAAARRVLCQLK